jgi:hypothetical protein
MIRRGDRFVGVTGMGKIHAFLNGCGVDSKGRSIAMVLAFSDSEIETTHDFIQWLFPLPVASAAQPQSPVLSSAEHAAIAGDAAAVANLQRANERMALFYAKNDHWLTWHDHNHLRITRILKSLRLIIGLHQAQKFYRVIEDRVKASPDTIDPHSIRFWTQALAQDA